MVKAGNLGVLFFFVNESMDSGKPKKVPNAARAAKLSGWSVYI
jgi:hypothetical protein